MIAGIDTGLGTLGWARFDPGRQRFDALGALTTEHDPTKGKTEDQCDRSELVAVVLVEAMTGCDVVVIEAMSFANANAIAPIALCFGAIVGIAAAIRPRPRLYTTKPKEWQREVVPTSGKRVDYDEVERTVGEFVRRTPTSTFELERLPRALRNHAIDGCALALMGAFRLERCRPLGGRRPMIHVEQERTAG